MDGGAGWQWMSGYCANGIGVGIGIGNGIGVWNVKAQCLGVVSAGPLILGFFVCLWGEGGWKRRKGRK